MGGRQGIPVAAALAALCAPVPGHAQPWFWAGRAIAAQPAADLPAEYRTLLATLDDHAATRDARDAAATRLVAASDPAVQAAVTQRITESGAASGPLLAAVSRISTPRAELFDPVREYVRAATADRVAPGLAALSGFRTPEAAGLLLEFTGPERPSAVRGAAFRALGRLSGRDDLAEDRAAWVLWYEGGRQLGRDEWNTLILAGLARRSDRLASEQSRAGARLSDAFRRLYLVVSGSSSEDRPKLLVGLLQDDRDELRALGFELVAREVSSGSAVDPAVGAAVIRLLGHGSAAVRAQAATLVSQMAPAGAGEAVAAALEDEADPVAAAGLLAAAARWPVAGMRDAAVRWAVNGEETRPGAVQLLLSMARAGLIADGDLGRVCDALVATNATELTPPEIKLLAAVGGSAGRRHVVGALKATAPTRRLAAAEALCAHAGFTDQILDTAASDPALFDAAARAVATHRADAGGLRALLALPSPSPAARAAGVSTAAESAPLPQVIDVAAGVDDRAERELLLGFLMEPRPGPDVVDQAAEARALLLLAEARLDLGRPDAALPVLAAIKPAGGVPADVVRDARTVALLWTGKIEEAEALGAPVSAWLDGLERAVAQAHAEKIGDGIDTKFGATMTAEQKARLALLTQRAQALARESPVPPP